MNSRIFFYVYSATSAAIVSLIVMLLAKYTTYGDIKVYDSAWQFASDAKLSEVFAYFKKNISTIEPGAPFVFFLLSDLIQEKKYFDYFSSFLLTFLFFLTARQSGINLGRSTLYVFGYYGFIIQYSADRLEIASILLLGSVLLYIRFKSKYLFAVCSVSAFLTHVTIIVPLGIILYYQFIKYDSTRSWWHKNVLIYGAICALSIPLLFPELVHYAWVKLTIHSQSSSIQERVTDVLALWLLFFGYSKRRRAELPVLIMVSSVVLILGFGRLGVLIFPAYFLTCGANKNNVIELGILIYLLVKSIYFISRVGYTGYGF